MITRKGISLLLAAMLLMSAALVFLPAAARAESSAAIIEGTDKITRGSTVWYGVLPEGESYDYDQANQPISWRVLDVNGSKELPVSGSGQALLISHKILSQKMAFGESNVWADSAAKTWCGAFGTALGAEADAAAQTSVTEENTVEDWYFYKGGYYNEYYGAASLSGEKFFCLSAKEADTYFTDDNDRKASGGSREWWLRSPIAITSDGVGDVDVDGWAYRILLRNSRCAARFQSES